MGLCRHTVKKVLKALFEYVTSSFENMILLLLHPAVKVPIKKENSLAYELKAKQAEILMEYEKDTLKTYPPSPTQANE